MEQILLKWPQTENDAQEIQVTIDHFTELEGKSNGLEDADSIQLEGKSEELVDSVSSISNSVFSSISFIPGPSSFHPVERKGNLLFMWANANIMRLWPLYWYSLTST